jgi:phosphoglycerate dehydrogenase-like enzyme
VSYDVICLRPEADFTRAGVTPPAELKIAYRAPDAADLPALMAEAHALLIPAVGPKLPAILFEKSSVKFVQITGAGVDRLDESAMKKLGIAIANVPGGSNAAVSEYAVTTAATLLRRFAWSDREIKSGNYAAFRARMIADNLAGLQGLTVGVVGLGVVGTAVAQAFHRNGAKITYFDPAPRDPAALAAMNAHSTTLEELLRTSDVVTLHVPLLPATQNLLNAKRLALMKADAILVNASRGGVVDEAALVAQLAAGKLGGAAVDVFSSEPPAADNPLLNAPVDAAQRLLLTPHIAGVTRQASTFLFQAACDNIKRVVADGQPPLNRVY